MTDRSHCRRALLLAAVLGTSACFNLDFSPKPTPPRLIDDVCAEDACTTTGAARQTTGPTSDSIGFHLGPGAGSVTIPLVDGTGFEVLAAGHGTLGAELITDGCTDCGSGSASLRDSYAWLDLGVAEDADGGSAVKLSVGDGSEADIADVRRQPPPGGCSVVAPR